MYPSLYNCKEEQNNFLLYTIRYYIYHHRDYQSRYQLSGFAALCDSSTQHYANTSGIFRFRCFSSPCFVVATHNINPLFFRFSVFSPVIKCCCCCCCLDDIYLSLNNKQTNKQKKNPMGAISRLTFFYYLVSSLLSDNKSHDTVYPSHSIQNL